MEGEQHRGCGVQERKRAQDVLLGLGGTTPTAVSGGTILVHERNRNQAKSLETWPGGSAVTARAFSLLHGDQPIIH